ncbi:Hypothetical predicted protein [Podarcis lilfordi]|uniref:Uncharacterized protein n=1 Tax=Podarcis lilfordi TaxID=74358 RepID=A0AA35LL75_9SAUR|nr:Hypothetical predicted protein [Podarcis lilfordi]
MRHRSSSSGCLCGCLTGSQRPGVKPTRRHVTGQAKRIMKSLRFSRHAGKLSEQQRAAAQPLKLKGNTLQTADFSSWRRCHEEVKTPRTSSDHIRLSLPPSSWTPS